MNWYKKTHTHIPCVHLPCARSPLQCFDSIQLNHSYTSVAAKRRIRPYLVCINWLKVLSILLHSDNRSLWIKTQLSLTSLLQFNRLRNHMCTLCISRTKLAIGIALDFKLTCLVKSWGSWTSQTSLQSVTQTHTHLPPPIAIQASFGIFQVEKQLAHAKYYRKECLHRVSNSLQRSKGQSAKHSGKKNQIEMVYKWTNVCCRYISERKSTNHIHDPT